MPEKTEAQKRAQKKYMENRSTVMIVVTPERRDTIKSHCEARGESMSAFINRAVDETMERDNAPQSAI